SLDERERIANLERIKGNEAFKAQDYEEAVLYYTRSLSVLKTPRTLNNRAQAYLKLKNYFAAVVDCNEVISLEPNNVKALFRRGIAHKEAEMFDLAAIDFEILLKLEPENKSAQDQLKQIENMKLQKMQAKKKVVIEEIESESSYDVVENNNIPDLHNKEISKRLTIEETTEDFRPLLDEICNCERNDDSIQPLSAKTKEMLNIFGDHSALAKNSRNGFVSTVETNRQTKSSQRSAERNTSLVLGEFSEETEFKKDFKEVKIQENNTEKPEIKSSPFGRSQNECSENPILKTEVKTHLEPNPEYESKPADEKISKDLHKSINKILPLTEQNKNETQPNINEILLKKVTPFEFLQVWLSNNSNINSNNGAICLLNIQPQQLPKILTNKIDGPLLNGLLMAIKAIANAGKMTEGFEYLKSLIKVPRIKVTASFLSTKEKTDIEDILLIMENKLETNLNQVRDVLINP
ncbi:sperm-associated antigen 1, partial [Trichonephila inaurata madagascariensis]